jgi:hypothetical protein
VAEAALQLERVVAGDGGKGERERVAQVVRAQWADVPGRVGVLGIVPAADLLADRVDRARGQAAVGSAGADRDGGQEQRGRGLAGVAGAFVLEVVGERGAGVRV